MKQFFWVCFVCLLFGACGESELPYLGQPVTVGGKKQYPKIADFTLVDQDSNQVSQATFKGKIHVAGFMFLSCPTICPRMTTALKEVYEATASIPGVTLVSYTIDPVHDRVDRLKAYATGLGVQTERWRFLTGNEQVILTLANQSYYATAYPDSTAPGGFTHSGGLLLVDPELHIRGVYNGTDSADTDRLIRDIKILAHEHS